MGSSIQVQLNKRGLDRIARNLDREVDDLLRDLASDTEKIAKQKMQEPKSGRTYHINLGGSIIEHIAAARGEAPAVLTRRLMDSGHTKRERLHQWAAIFATEYARRQEFGGTDRRGIYIPPHPYLRPAADEVTKDIPRKMKRISILHNG
jgi:hypothetical protein